MVRQNINSFACDIGNEVKPMNGEIPTIMGMCTKCGFYNDCPMEYLCPAAEILLDILITVFEDEDE